MQVTTSRKHKDILGLDPQEIAALIEPVSPKTYTSRQIFGWVYAKGVYDFYCMHNLSKPLRRALSSKFTIRLPALVRSVSSHRERVSKYLLSLSDRSSIECVLIGMRDKDTFCVSTQVGCRFGCAFCATGRMGFERNLSASEILGQVLFLRSASERDRQLVQRPFLDGARPDKLKSAEDESPGRQDESSLAPTLSPRGFNVVFMGMGEPLDNYENTVKAIRIMQHPDGLAIGGRRITVSTCGIPAKIKRLAREDLGVGLALSLNATTDELRTKLTPAGRQFPLKRVLEATRYFAEKSGRRITLEYVLIAGINDRPSDAKRLVSIASSLPCKINLIALNSSPGVKLEPPSDEAVRRFVQVLYPRAPTVTLRKSKGSDIMAACGQLRTDIAPDKPGVDKRRREKVPERARSRARTHTPRRRTEPNKRRGRARGEREDRQARTGRRGRATDNRRAPGRTGAPHRTSKRPPTARTSTRRGRSP